MRAGAILPAPHRLAQAPTADRTRYGSPAGGACDRTALRDAMPSYPCYRNGSISGGAVTLPELSDCTCASLMTAAVLASAVNGAAIPWAPEPLITGLFGAVAGVPEDQLAAVSGLDPLDVLRHVVVNGFGVGLQAPLVPRAGQIDATDRAAIADGIRAVPLWSAVALRQADEDALATGAVLDVAATPGRSVGGHMLVLVGFAGPGDADQVLIATYGGWASATWPWIMERGVAHFLLHWEPPVAPAGTDLGCAGSEGWALV